MMEVVPEIVDFRLTGNFMTRCFIVNNKNSVRLDIVVPAASGPFVLHPVAACETEVTWTTEPQPGTGLQCIRAQIPPKHMMQFRVDANLTNLHNHRLDHVNHEASNLCMFPVIPVDSPADTQCATAVSQTSIGNQQRLAVVDCVLALLKDYGVAEDVTKTLCLKANEKVCELLLSGKGNEGSTTDDELETAHDQQRMPGIPAEAQEILPSLSQLPQPMCVSNAEIECDTVAFQAVKVEMNGRHGSVVKVVPVPYHTSNKPDDTLKPDILVDAPSIKFQLSGKWYDARGTELDKACLTQHGCQGSPEHLLSQEQRSGSGRAHPACDVLRDAALAAAKAELGLTHLPDPLVQKGSCGDFKPCLPQLSGQKNVTAFKGGQLCLPTDKSPSKCGPVRSKFKMANLSL